MRYSLFALAALSASTAALPVAVPAAQLVDSKPGSTVELGRPSTVVTWGRRGVVFEPSFPKDTIELSPPSTVVTWGKRDLTWEPSKPEDTVELGKPSTEVTWGKE